MAGEIEGSVNVWNADTMQFEPTTDSGGKALQLPTGHFSDRDQITSPTEGMLRFNSNPNRNRIETFNGVRWQYYAYVHEINGVWHAGSGVPVISQDNEDNDFYLNFDNGDIYRRESGVWILRGNISGAGYLNAADNLSDVNNTQLSIDNLTMGNCVTVDQLKLQDKGSDAVTWVIEEDAGGSQSLTLDYGGLEKARFNTDGTVEHAAPTSANHSATKAYVDMAVSGLVDSAPVTLDTLNELAAALNDDPNFATTITTQLGTKLNLTGGTMTGDLILNADPTLALGAATKQYVDGAVATAGHLEAANNLNDLTNPQDGLDNLTSGHIVNNIASVNFFDTASDSDIWSIQEDSSGDLAIQVNGFDAFKITSGGSMVWYDDSSAFSTGSLSTRGQMRANAHVYVDQTTGAIEWTTFSDGSDNLVVRESGNDALVIEPTTSNATFRGNILAEADGTQDIGDSTNAFDTIYVNNIVGYTPPSFSNSNILWVDPNGNDSNTGAFDQPFQTIAAAVGAAGFGTTIRIMPGSYNIATLSINAVDNLFLEGWGGPDSHTVELQGALVLTGTTTRFRMKDIQLDASALATAAITFSGSNGRHFFENVSIVAGSGGDAIHFTNGEQRWHEFKEGSINGRVWVENTATGSSASFTEVNGVEGGWIDLDDGDTTVVMQRCFRWNYVDHADGILSLYDCYRWNGNGSGEAIVSSASAGLLHIEGNTFLQPSGYATINKTGTCDWVLANTNRDVTNDVLTGARLFYGTNARDIETVSGPTANRPTGVSVGFQYFDTTITPSRPIYWDGTNWVDAFGTVI